MQNFELLDLNNLRGILVDIDDTLYDYKSAHNFALSYCYNNFKQLSCSTMSEQAFKTKYRTYRNAVTARLENQGSCRSRFLAFLALFEEIKEPKPFVLAKNFEEIYWNNLIENMSPNIEFIEWLIKRKKDGITICAVTDMQARIQIDKIEALGLTEVIDFLVSSEEVGHEKPHPSMFKEALRKLNVSADQAIMFGDSKVKDIEGAQAVGIQSCLITNYL